MNNGMATTEASAIHPEDRSYGAERLRQEEDALLEAGGFEQEVGAELWAKEGVCYGREAALQKARR